MKQKEAKQGLYQEIETLREKLHRQKDITSGDTLKLSAELDQLILKAMKDKEEENLTAPYGDS